MRIRITTRPGASPHPISTTTATNKTVRSSHEWAPSPPARIPQGEAVHLAASELLPGGAAVLVSGGLAATPRGRGADRAPDATTIPLAALQHATTDGQVSA
jgi:hypothetical protein